MSKSEAADDSLWAGISDSVFSDLVSDIEDLPRKPPLQSMRHGHVWVSDLSSQIWCEQKLVYNLTLPVKIVPEPEYVTAGKSIHLARELEVHDTVPVKITSKEDRFAVKLLNLLTGIESFHLGNPTLREVPIFGIPFGSNVFVSGIIDELRLDVDSFEIDVVELKTRREKSIPSLSTTIGYRFQVMLYKSLLDDLIKGKTSKQDIVKHLKLRPEKEFGEDVLSGLLERYSSTRNLNGLFDEVLCAVQTIPCPSNVFIEYCSQEDGQTFHLDPVQFDEQWLKEKCLHLFDFWKGNRQTEGVSACDTWKCNYCDFADFCEWRKKQTKELQNKVDVDDCCIVID